VLVAQCSVITSDRQPRTHMMHCDRCVPAVPSVGRTRLWVRPTGEGGVHFALCGPDPGGT